MTELIVAGLLFGVLALAEAILLKLEI